jgi:four helix bundle protein
LGSQAEVEVQVEIARQLGFIDESRFGNLRHRIDLVGRLLNRLLDSLQDHQPPSTVRPNPHR